MVECISLLCLFCGIDTVEHLYESWDQAFERNSVYHIVSEQMVYWPLAGQKTERMMELWFAPPNLFNVSYSEPDSQIIIADGARVWTIVPENNQVLYQDQDPDITWRDTPLGELLSAEAKQCRCDSVNTGNNGGGELVISCEDFGKHSPWVTVTLFITEGEIWPKKAVLTDISDNQTTYSVTKWEELPRHASSDTLFAFRKPSGYDVVSVD